MKNGVFLKKSLSKKYFRKKLNGNQISICYHIHKRFKEQKKLLKIMKNGSQLIGIVRIKY